VCLGASGASVTLSAGTSPISRIGHIAAALVEHACYLAFQVARLAAYHTTGTSGFIQ
jgi:hypothetical protein